MRATISTRETQFDYFDRLLESPDWKGKKILDFGGNVGGFLVSAGDRVLHEDYWCLDLNRPAVELGSQRFPQAHFCHYNRYSSEYNPGGVRNFPIPDMGLKFDIVLAFSVFTHTHQNEMLELVEQLRAGLAPQGVLAFTFTDPSYERSLSDPGLPPGTDVRKMLGWRQTKKSDLEIEEMIETARLANWCLLIDDRLYVEPGGDLSNQDHQGNPGESYNSYYKVDYMATIFPEARVLPPVSPEWQHCCILKPLG